MADSSSIPGYKSGKKGFSFDDWPGARTDNKRPPPTTSPRTRPGKKRRLSPEQPDHDQLDPRLGRFRRAILPSVKRTKPKLAGHIQAFPAIHKKRPPPTTSPHTRPGKERRLSPEQPDHDQLDPRLDHEPRGIMRRLEQTILMLDGQNQAETIYSLFVHGCGCVGGGVGLAHLASCVGLEMGTLREATWDTYPDGQWEMTIGNDWATAPFFDLESATGALEELLCFLGGRFGASYFDDSGTMLVKVQRGSRPTQDPGRKDGDSRVAPAATPLVTGSTASGTDADDGPRPWHLFGASRPPSATVSHPSCCPRLGAEERGRVEDILLEHVRGRKDTLSFVPSLREGLATLRVLYLCWQEWDARARCESRVELGLYGPAAHMVALHTTRWPSVVVAATSEEAKQVKAAIADMFDPADVEGVVYEPTGEDAYVWAQPEVQMCRPLAGLPRINPMPYSELVESYGAEPLTAAAPRHGPAQPQRILILPLAETVSADFAKNLSGRVSALGPNRQTVEVGMTGVLAPAGVVAVGPDTNMALRGGTLYDILTRGSRQRPVWIIASR